MVNVEKQNMLAINKNELHKTTKEQTPLQSKRKTFADAMN